MQRVQCMLLSLVLAGNSARFCSYTLLLKSPVLMCSCFSTIADMTILTRLTISEELQVVSKRQLYIVLPEHQCVIKRQLNS